MRHRQSQLLYGLLLFLLPLLAYLPAIQAGFIWDDDVYITHNPLLVSTDGLRQIWAEPTSIPQYYPMVHTTFWLEYRLWELYPAGFHLTNILLHALAAYFVWKLLARWDVPGAWLAAAVFAVHPVHVESVAWVAERKNVLSGVFYLAAMLAYFRFRPAREPDRPSDEARRAADNLRRGLWYAAAAVLFLCALLSKTVTASLPAAILVIVWWQRGRIGWRDVVPLLPMFAVGLAMGLYTAHLEKHHVGAEGADWDLSPVERCLVAGRAVWFYASKLVFPYRLTFNYPRWEIDAGTLWQYAFLVTATALVLVAWALRQRIGRGPLAAILFFGGTLFPALGFIDVYPMRYSFVADHFQYLASLGLISLIVAAGTTLAGRSSRTQSWRPKAAAGALLLAMLGWLTLAQCHAYRDLESLWLDTIQKNPGSWMAHNNLGEVYKDRGMLNLARKHYRETLRVKPDSAEAYNNLGAIIAQQGDVDGAIAHYKRAIAIDPEYGSAHFNLGNALAEKGDVDAAIAAFERTVQFAPEFVMARYNLGTLLSGRGRHAEALAQLEEALRLSPDFPEAHVNMATALEQLGRVAEAVGHYQRALEIRPEYGRAHTNLGRLLLDENRPEEAADHFLRAIEISPNNAAARHGLDRAREQIRAKQ